MPVKTKLTFTIQKNLKVDFQERLIRDGYGLRGKNRWISETIHSLLEIKNFCDLVNYNDEMTGFDQMETVVIDYGTKIRKSYRRNKEKISFVKKGKKPYIENINIAKTFKNIKKLTIRLYMFIFSLISLHQINLLICNRKMIYFVTFAGLNMTSSGQRGEDSYRVEV